MFTPAEESQTFLQLTTLCQDRTLVGMKLLDKISSVPHGELSCSKFLAIFLRFGPKLVFQKSSRVSLSKTQLWSVFLLWLCTPPAVNKFLVQSPKFIDENLENVYGKVAQNLKSHEKVNL